ncbi:MAG: LPS-assembly protein LptD [Pseudomonadales bacterium]
MRPWPEGAPTGSSGAGAQPAEAPPGTGDLASSLWVPRTELPAERLAGRMEFCSGGYRELTFAHPLGSDPDTFPIRGASDTVSYDVDGDIELVGNVRIDQGNRTVEAARTRLRHDSRRAEASGGVRLKEPGLVVQGSAADVDLKSGAATVDNVQFVLIDAGLRGEARSLGQDEANTLVMTDGSFTRCEPGNDSWRIGASSVRVEQGEVFGRARNAVVRVGPVPVFYAPYIRFPVSDERQSGWLFPNLGYSNEDGIDVSLPYYLNLAPDYDATLIPRYVADRGVGLEGEFRHLSGWEETTLAGAFLYDDDLYDGELERDDFDALAAEGLISGEFVPADRWLYAMEHAGGFGNFATRVDYTAVSDRDYFRNLGSDLGVSSQIELERRGEIEYAAGDLLVRLWAQRFQRLDEGLIDPYQRLPEVDLSYSRRLLGPLEWSLGASYVTFTRDNDALSGIAAAVGDRAHVEPRVRIPLSSAWGFLTLTGGYRYTAYDLRDVPDAVDATPTRSIGLGSVNTGLFFERDLNLFGASVVQTLEPQLYYLYQEYVDQDELPSFDASRLTFGYSQLFRDNRFSGVDRIGDANQLSVGLTTRFLGRRDGREYFRASVGEIVYFDDRRVTLSGTVGDDERQTTSALAVELAASIAGGWGMNGTVIWDPNDGQVDELGAGLQYRRDNRHIVNLGYRKRIEDNIDQTDLSFYWPVSERFALMGRWNYDVVSGRTIEGFGGVEYNDCCWRIGLMARRFIDSPTGRFIDSVKADEGIFLQIVFKGLAGFGNKLESVLERGIRGYRMENQ